MRGRRRCRHGCRILRRRYCRVCGTSRGLSLIHISLAPEHDIENAKLIAKAGDDPKKLRKIKKKQPPEGFVTWNKQTFERLIEAVPETLKPRMRITHSMVLSEVVQGGDAYTRVRTLIADSAQTDEEKAALYLRADEIFQTLIDADVDVYKRQCCCWVKRLVLRRCLALRW